MSRAAEHKAWREANKERVATYSREYNERNKEKRAAYKRAWYEKNREHCLQYAKDYVSENRESVAENSKRYKADNREAISANHREWYQKNPGKAALYTSRQRDKKPLEYRERIKQWELANPVKVLATKKSSSAKRRTITNGQISEYFAFKECLESYRIGNSYWDVYNCCLIDNPSVDHITPVTKGGTNDFENLCVTSASSNSSKHNKLLILWLAEQANKQGEVCCFSKAS